VGFATTGAEHFLFSPFLSGSLRRAFVPRGIFRRKDMSRPLPPAKRRRPAVPFSSLISWARAIREIAVFLYARADRLCLPAFDLSPLSTVHGGTSLFSPSPFGQDEMFPPRRRKAAPRRCFFAFPVFLLRHA